MTECGATFDGEVLLPRLPLPTLADSCARLAEWCAPLLSADERAATEAGLDSLLQPGSPAWPLQSALARYHASEGVESWLDDFWISRYLGRRDRIALNANFFLLLEDCGQGQLERAGALAAAAVDFKLRLDQQLIPPVVWRGRRQSMEQFKYLFSATRIPGRLTDSVRTPYSHRWPGPSSARHIVVFRRGSIFRLDVIRPDGLPHTSRELAAGLRAVVAACPRAGAGIGHLTSKARAEWAESRQALLACHPRNTELLDTVETALFALCLEDVCPPDTLTACDQLLHGDGGNRWFDKSFSLIVFPDGRAGLNVEHCNLDGVTIAHFARTLLDAVAAQADETRAWRKTDPAFSVLDFALDARLRQDVRSAAASFAAATRGIVTDTLTLADFGVDQAKELGVSPDAFVQMAFQLAYQRAGGGLGSTYESVATRGFRHGRTEAMRVTSPQVVHFLSAMADPAADGATRRTAFRAAAAKHAERVRQCQAGLAPEQHLWELQLLQRRRGRELRLSQPLTLDSIPGWVKLRDEYLSTSSASADGLQYIGFGPTSGHCLGIGYLLLRRRLSLYLSAPQQMRDTLSGFAECFPKAVSELAGLLADDQ